MTTLIRTAQVLATTAALVGGIAFAADAAPSPSTGTNSNTIDSVSSKVTLKAGGVASMKYAATCNPHDYSYVDPARYGSVIVYAELRQTVNGVSTSGWTKVQNARAGGSWDCDSTSKALVQPVLPSVGKPAWVPGKGLILVYLFGQDMNNKFFKVVERQQVTLSR